MVYCPGVDELPVYCVKPVWHCASAVSVSAVSTGMFTRRKTSAECGLAQSTTSTVTTAGSVGGGAARHSPGLSSVHRAVCAAASDGAEGAAVETSGTAGEFRVDGADEADAGPGLALHAARRGSDARSANPRGTIWITMGSCLARTAVPVAW